MNWLSSFYAKHPEYRSLRVARRSACSIHFELEPGLYEAHFQVKPMWERSVSNLWLPAGQLAALGRLIGASVRNPRLALEMAAGLPFATVFTDPGIVTTSADTIILSGAPTNTYNYGGTSALALSPSRKSLYRFNCTSIQKTASLVNASFRITSVNSPYTSAWTETVYSVAAGNSAWIAGTKNGAQAGAGEPCWNALAADGLGGATTAWAGSAGMSTSGTDYEAAPLGSVNGNANNAAFTNYVVAFTGAALVRIGEWFGSPNTNYGILSVWSNTTQQLAFSDHATAAYRPQLVVTYSTQKSAQPFSRVFTGPFAGPFG